MRPFKGRRKPLGHPPIFPERRGVTMFAFAFVVGVVVLVGIFVNIRALMYAWSGRYELDRRVDAATR
jgi:hypothetical protein